MNITARDRKILIVVVVLGSLLAFWFLLLSPKRAEVAQIDEEIAAQTQERDAAVQQAASAQQARDSFQSDYAELVRLGKAIPTTVDMPSLLIQLDSAARGTDIEFERVTAGQRTAAPAPTSAPPAAPEGDAAPGGESAGSAPGQAAETAGETVEDANATSEELDTETSQNARDGAVPVGGGQSGDAAGQPGGGSSAPGLETVPLDFSFKGDFFDLADFFHQLKRFVRVGGDGRIAVRGRLMTIDSFTFAPDEAGDLRATIKATAYLAPKSEGATAGATPQGPAPESAAASAPPATPPTAAVQP